MKLGLALSGGALRGAAHVGVLKALEEHNIKADLIAGTSAGSLIAALYATGMTIEEMLNLAPDINSSLVDINFLGLIKYITRISKDFTGFVKGNRLEEYVKRRTQGKKLNEANIPLLMVASDIQTGCKIVYSSHEIANSRVDCRGIIQLPSTEPIYKAVRASCSIPIAFNSVKVYGYELVDGGIKDNVPVELLKQLGADKVIAVNLGFTGQRDKINDPWEYLMQTIDIMGNQISTEQLKEADYVIKPHIYDVSTLDFSKVEECIQRGYIVTSNLIEDIKKTLEL